MHTLGAVDTHTHTHLEQWAADCAAPGEQSWTSCRSRDSNPKPWVTLGFKSNALSIRPTTARSSAGLHHTAAHHHHSRERPDKDQLQSDFDSLNKRGPVCFFISTELKSWSDSRQYCRDHGSDLIIINTEEKQVSLCECLLMNDRNLTYSCFYSLRDSYLH